MSLEKQKQELVIEAVTHPELYKQTLNKWERLGLTEKELNLAIGESEKTKYYRKSIKTNNTKQIAIGTYYGSTFRQLKDAVSKLENEVDDNTILAFSNYGNSGGHGNYITYSKTRNETDVEFAKRIKASRMRMYNKANEAEIKAKKARDAKIATAKYAINNLDKATSGVVSDVIEINGTKLSKEELIKALLEQAERIES